jgi:hypothetical protein
MRLNSILFSLLTCISIFLSCQSKDQKPFEDIPDTYPVLKKVLQNPDGYQVQIRYTQIDRDENNVPSFRDFDFRLNDDKYFYPASTVKLPVAILALEWLGEQGIDGLTANSVMLTDSVRLSQFPAYYDSTASNLLPSIAHYIKKILLVSDNDAYNRLYELLGQDYINSKMQEKGMNHTIINHRLSMPMSEEENRYFNPISFRDEKGEIILEIPERKTDNIYANLDHPKIGKAYYSKGELIEAPMDFTFKNKFALSDFHGVVKRIVFPVKFAPKEQFNLSEEDRNFILRYMSLLPGESDYPKYDLPEYYDSYSKFFKFGTDNNPIPAQFRIFNKTGNAYGHLLDGSYFVDFENDIEFFVTAVIYTNANETLNDDTYEYEEIAFPFFAELGEYLYRLELKRTKEITPVLSGFKLDY